MPEDKLLDHDMDGIQEYDNPLPEWWVQLFAITVIIAYYYFVGFLMTDMSHGQRADMVVKKLRTPDGAVEQIEMKFLDDPQVIALGQNIFKARCASCHGQKAEGLIGPNLTDNYWLHGHTFPEMFNTVSNGVVEKGMQAWKGVLTDAEIQAVISYEKSLRGTNPPNAKAPQGEFVE